MASTHKTPYLYLNNWLGSDKPKKDDFNADNEKIDAAYSGLNTRLQASDQVMGTLVSHTRNNELHITAAEKLLWNSGGAVEIGAYTGTGTATRAISLGFKPRFGYLFAIGQNAVDGNWNTGECNIYSGFFSSQGCSNFITITDTGITVEQHITRPANGAAVKFNQTGIQYVYLAWK